MEYTVFGQVIKGLDIIDAIAGQPTDKRDRPLQDVKIVSIKIIK
jgi:cyclophilin family peptidyl-prolyl cis-trans isomerase